MEEKVFRFHGLDFKRVLIGSLLLSVATLCGFFAPIFLLDADSPTLSAITAGLTALLFLTIGRGYLKSLWTVKISGGVTEIYLGDTLKSRFALSDLEKIHIRGWSNKKSYCLLRLTTRQGKLRIFVDSAEMTKITSIREMEIFDELVAALESYALANKYLKKDLKKSFTHADFKNYFYLRDQNI